MVLCSIALGGEEGLDVPLGRCTRFLRSLLGTLRALRICYSLRRHLLIIIYGVRQECARRPCNNNANFKKAWDEMLLLLFGAKLSEVERNKMTARQSLDRDEKIFSFAMYGSYTIEVYAEVDILVIHSAERR